MLEDVFQKIILNYPKLNSKQIRSEIGYALNNRNKNLSKKIFNKFLDMNMILLFLHLKIL